MKEQEKLVYPTSGLCTEDFFDPKSKENVPIAVYRGIPYADAERFRESTVRETIPEKLPILPATPHFPQPNDFNLSNWLTLPRTLKKEHVTYASETDPLYLNIFTKQIHLKNKPVILYVHGGSLLIGGASSYDGHALAAVGDVIFISINYRLGSFGTMFGGNWALSDVLSALQWVELHIHKFGGDKENVTLMGYSAGGMIVDHLMSSPRSKGLFHRAIAMSGNASCAWTWTREEKKEHNMRRLKEILGKDNDEKIREIVTKMPFEEFLQKIEYPAWTEPDYFYWTFCTEESDSILPSFPYADLEESFKIDIPYMMGRTNDEGCYSMSFYHHPKFLEGLSEEDFQEVVIRTAKGRRMIPENFAEEKYPEIIEENFGSEFDKSDKFYFTKIFGKWFGEMEIGIGIEARARSMKNAFVYRNCYKPLFAKNESFRGELTSNRPDWSKTDHGDCYSFIFGIPFYEENAQNVQFSDKEKDLSLRWIENLTHFATFGKPKDTRWKPFSISEERMKIGEDGVSSFEKMSKEDKKYEEYFEKFMKPLFK